MYFNSFNYFTFNDCYDVRKKILDFRNNTKHNRLRRIELALMNLYKNDNVDIDQVIIIDLQEYLKNSILYYKYLLFILFCSYN